MFYGVVVLLLGELHRVRRPGVVERRIVRARQTQRNFRLLLRFKAGESVE